MDAKRLVELADDLFSKKGSLDSLHQEIAENFYPERAEFTTIRSLGDEFMEDLMSSYPVVCRRELGDQFGSMLRPTARSWFHVARKFSDREEDHEVKALFQYFEETMRRAMYDRVACLTKATKIGDHDFATFGQCALSVEQAFHPVTGPQLLYRCWHLRDMAWQENEFGSIGCVFRLWKPSALTLSRTFSNLHPEVTKMLDKTPFCEVEVLHMVVDAEMYDGDARRRPRWSIWWDKKHNHLIEATPIWNRHYVIPRWNTLGSQYASSPAVIAALPDARLIQAMTFTLLEAGEKAANPPIVATQNAVRSDVAVFAGGITWLDEAYDERLGDALRPLTQDFRGLNFGAQMVQDTRALLHKAFFLDSLTLPQRSPEMTAYEVGQRVQEYIRNALPIFEPMEQEYNAALCDETFEIMLRGGAFGSPMDWPKNARNMEIDFQFESPLHDAIDQQKGQQMIEGMGLLAQAVQLDPSVQFLPDAKKMIRDALNGIRWPAQWMRSESEVQEMSDQQKAQQQQQQLLAMLEQGSAATANLAGAQKDISQAQQVI